MSTTKYTVEFDAWKQNGKRIACIEGYSVSDFYPQFERDTEYSTRAEAEAVVADYRGADIDGVDCLLTIEEVR